VGGCTWKVAGLLMAASVHVECLPKVKSREREMETRQPLDANKSLCKCQWLQKTW